MTILACRNLPDYDDSRRSKLPDLNGFRPQKSVGLRWHSHEALILRNEEILAPDFFLCEIANAFWKYVHAGLMTREEATLYFKAAQGLPTRLVRQNDSMPEVLHAAARLDHPVYDIIYLVLARRMDATLMTIDRKPMDLCEQEGVDCIVTVTPEPA